MGQSKLSPVLRFVAIALLCCSLAGVSGAAEINDRMSIVDAIQSVRDLGLDVSYSSLLVEPWMRVRFTPKDTDPLHALQQVLAEYGLALEESRGAGWLVVRVERPVTARTFAVRGRIVDADTGTSIAAARVTVNGRQVTTGADGEFEITDLSGSNRNLQIVADGYVSLQRELATDDTASEYVFDLEPVALPNLEEITIVASRHSMFDRTVGTDHFLTAEAIQLMPHAADDAFRAFHRLPGVAASDFSAPMNLRGGRGDEVQVVLDGIEIFEPYHMRTLFSPLSIVDAGIIETAEVYSGGFTAENGDYSSGVIDISSEIPGSQRRHEVGLSFTSTFARTSGQFDSGKGKYLFSARRGFLDLIADKLSDENEKLTPRYGDFFGKISHRPNDAFEARVGVLFASDDVSFMDNENGEDSGGDSSQRYAWVNTSYDPSDNLSIGTTLFSGRVKNAEIGMLHDAPETFIDRENFRKVSINGLQSLLSWRPSQSRLVKIGMRYRDLASDFDYQINSFRQSIFFNNSAPLEVQRDIVKSVRGEDMGVFAAYRHQFLPSIIGEIGVRWDKQTYINTVGESQISPRLNALFRLSDRTELKIGVGEFYQPQAIQNLQIQDGIEEYHPAQVATHYVVGLNHQFKSGLEMKVDLYSKRYRRLQPLFENSFDILEFAAESNFDRVRINADRANARGLEMTLRNRGNDSVDWWLNYSLSSADDEADGVKIPRSWDQENSLTGSVVWHGNYWTFSAVARYRSGWPRTNLVTTPIFDDAGNVIGFDSDFSSRNQKRYKDYSRLDVRLSRAVPLRRSEFTYYFEILNVLNTKNECCVPDFVLDDGAVVSVSPNINDFLPFFPSFGFVWTFGPGAGDE